MTSPGSVALLQRKPGTSRAEFGRHWLHQHAPLVIPWALARGCTSYIQYHNISLTPAADKAEDQVPIPTDFDIEEYDGAAVMVFGGEAPAGAPPAEKLDEYFAQVVAPDELRFLVGRAQETARFVDKRLIGGEKLALIENGKPAKGSDGREVVDLTQGWELWKQWGFDPEPLK